MIAPDGTPGDIPQERMHEAVKAGFKIGAELKAPSGQMGIVPIDRIHDAINAGFMLQGAAIPAPQAPGDLNPSVPDAGDVAAKLTAKYVPAMQMAMGGGGLEKVGGAAVEAATNPAVRSAVGKAATAASEVVSPDIVGIVSPRAADGQRALGRPVNDYLPVEEALPRFAAVPKASDPQALRDWWASRGGGLADRPIDRYEFNRAKANTIGMRELKQPAPQPPQTFAAPEPAAPTPIEALPEAVKGCQNLQAMLSISSFP